MTSSRDLALALMRQRSAEQRHTAGRSPSLAAETREALARLNLSPRRRRGQNFLVDRNLRDALLALAAVRSDQVVLEVGGGLGVLSVELAQRARYLHVVELDERLVPWLRERLADLPASVHHGDALALHERSLEPPPDRLVANLPYSIAQSFLVHSITALPTLQDWIAMVQLEVAERLAATPGTRTWGLATVLVQAACEVRIERRVPPEVFVPRPRVWSAIVRLRRVRDALSSASVQLVRTGFAHRRKPLASSLARAGLVAADERPIVRSVLEALGYPPDARAEQLSPDAWRKLPAVLAERGVLRRAQPRP